jgi:catechol 2,3-dioxygenase-like lactoylglutathione lyase family enzyme
MGVSCLDAPALHEVPTTETYHRGRLVDHVHLRVSDLPAAKLFYRAVLATLGRASTGDSLTHIVFDELWIDAADAHGSSRVHLAFQAPDRDSVDRFHAAGLNIGGTDNARPGERPYHPGYYSAFLRDPDGNNIEAVLHGAARRNVDSVEITPAG